MPLDQPGFQWNVINQGLFSASCRWLLSFAGNFCNKARRIHFGIYEHAWYHWLLSPMGVGSQFCTLYTDLCGAGELFFGGEMSETRFSCHVGDDVSYPLEGLIRHQSTSRMETCMYIYISIYI